ncbi:winged helix-turn-helix transcriptional regulator [Nocardia cyriacigeorgica]|uniref:Winged helix-turn-helix transcriptional regulator n=1 Tax=Nocardia cyriacigeorgica TaxID=135487 RepID=A0A5R8P693_9NOCA|nr:MarR family winged helix-turn-helix transcriptional regulator [Nocardia cyriacigeorgica]TLF94931.1 winged helix-turn-helix transcriptional regulator [Nocardia cyriacigeorgica]
MDQNRRASERPGDPRRLAIETDIASDLRALTAVSEQLGHVFARSNNLRPNDFRALLHIATAEFEGTPLTPGRLGRLMGMSSAAVTYLVERMIESGHLRRDTDDTDRRKVLLRHDQQGRTAAENFFIPVGTRTRAAMAEFSDDDLRTTHRVLTAVIAALRDHLDEVTTPGR